MRRNPLIFDNRFASEPTKRYPRSRTVASLVAPPRQRAQVERLADSPHTFRMIVLDDTEGLDLSSLSQPGGITLVTGLKLTAEQEIGARSSEERFGRGARQSIYSAFTLLHRLGDALLPILLDIVTISRVAGALSSKLSLATFKQKRGPSAYVPAEKISDTTLKLAAKVHAAAFKASRNGVYGLERYIALHTNSHMSREGLLFNEPIMGYFIDMTQCVADWVALSEMPSTRARPGRGEPWLLFPPKPREYPPEAARGFRAYAKAINTYFPPFIQSLLDDLDGAVIRI